MDKAQNIGRHTASVVEFLKKEGPLREKSRSFHYCYSQQRGVLCVCVKTKKTERMNLLLGDMHESDCPRIKTGML